MPALLILLAAALWGTTGTTQALAPVTASPVAVGTIRLLIGSAVLLVITRARLSAVPALPLILSGAAMALYQVFFFSGVIAAGVAVGTTVAIGSAPLLAGVGARLFMGERLNGRWWVATSLAIAGLALLLGAATDSIDPKGVGLSLAAGACYAVYVMGSKRLVGAGAPDQAMAAVFALAALLLAVGTRRRST